MLFTAPSPNDAANDHNLFLFAAADNKAKNYLHCELRCEKRNWGEKSLRKCKRLTRTGINFFFTAKTVTVIFANFRVFPGKSLIEG